MGNRFVAKYIGKGYVVRRIKNGECIEEQFVECGNYIDFCNQIGCVPFMED